MRSFLVLYDGRPQERQWLLIGLERGTAKVREHRVRWGFWCPWQSLSRSHCFRARHPSRSRRLIFGSKHQLRVAGLPVWACQVLKHLHTRLISMSSASLKFRLTVGFVVIIVSLWLSFWGFFPPQILIECSRGEIFLAYSFELLLHIVTN